MQTAINTCFGILIGSGLWLIGIPNAGLWGLIGAMFRFVPYVGVPVAAFIPVALAFAIDPQWWKMLETMALYLAIEPVLGQAIEPVVYGRSIGFPRRPSSWRLRSGRGCGALWDCSCRRRSRCASSSSAGTSTSCVFSMCFSAIVHRWRSKRDCICACWAAIPTRRRTKPKPSSRRIRSAPITMKSS